MKPAACVLAALLGLLAGCVSPLERRSLAFAPGSAVTYQTADERKWVLAYSVAKPNGCYRVEFVPDGSTDKKWSEKIGFAIVSPAEGSKEKYEKGLADLKAEFDPGLVYLLEGNERDFFYSYHSSKNTENGAARFFRVGDRYATVSYRGRLGPADTKVFSSWVSLLKKMPSTLPAYAATSSDPLITHTPQEGEQIHYSIKALSPVDRPPKLRHHPALEFQFDPARRGTPLKIEAEILVSTDGTVSEVKMIEATFPALFEAAESVLHRAVFRPAVLQGAAVPCPIRINFEFTL